MDDNTIYEATPEPPGNMKAAGLCGAGRNPTPEVPGAMLDVHPPHDAIHTLKSFFFHIATIVVGLVIAVGLEQTVEFFHHRHQRQRCGAAQ